MFKMTTSVLGNIASVQTGPFGSQLHKDDYVDSGTPIITVEHLVENKISHENLPLVSDEDKIRLSKYILKEGDIVFSRVGSVDRCAYVSKNEDGWLFSGRCLRIRVDETKVNPRYLSYYFAQSSFKSYIRKIAVGATMPSLNTAIMSELELNLPPLPVQKKIAAILSSLDDKIEINTRMNKVLEETARTLFHRWFVEFEFPNDEGKPYKSSGGRMIASEMGEIPEGWTIKRAQEICNISIGKTPPRKETQWFTSNSSDVKWISISDMGSSGMFVLDSSEYLTVDAIEKFNIVTVPKDTVILSFKLTIGRVSITSEDLVTNEAIAHFKTNIQELREYLYFTLKCYDYVSLGSTSSIATAINSKIIKNMNILLPHINLIKDYHALVLPIFEIIRTNQTEINQLKKIRETVLPKLMGGGIIS